MRRLFILLVLAAASGCSKKDAQLFKKHQDRNRCTVVSVNADKQHTDDFFMIKTFENGLLTHINTQVGDIYGTRFQMNYTIAYAQNKAVFHGSTRAFDWVLDSPPEDPGAPSDPRAPRHPEENAALRHTRDFEILLHPKTRFPIEVRYVRGGESILKLRYNDRGFLSDVGNFIVTTDAGGNILSVLTAPLEEEEPYYGPQQQGIWYTYSDRVLPSGTSQFYETPTIFISRMYALLELLNWGPFQPNRERIHVTVQHNYGDEYLPSPLMDADYYNHQYDHDGKLIKYDFEGAVRRELPYIGADIRQSGRRIAWKCAGRDGKF